MPNITNEIKIPMAKNTIGNKNSNRKKIPMAQDMNCTRYQWRKIPMVNNNNGERYQYQKFQKAINSNAKKYR